MAPKGAGKGYGQMAKLATPHLKDVAPTLTDLQSVGDRLIEVATVGAPLSAVRITVASEQGDVQAVLLASVGDDNGTPYYTDLSVAVAKGCQPEVTARVNRLLKDFSFSRPSGPASVNLLGSPIVGMNWRTKSVAVKYRRKAVNLPVHATTKLSVGASTISTWWNVRSTPVAMDTNLIAGFAPLSKSSAPKRRTARGRSRSSQPLTPTIRQQVTPLGSQQTPSGVNAAPPVTPKGVTQKAIPVAPKAKPSVLPPNHPNIFAELAPKPWAVHLSPEVTRKLEAAYAEFATSTEGPVVAMLRGPSGAGKTLAAMNLAATKGLPFAKFEVAGLRDFSDWFGSVSLREVNGHVVTDYVPSNLAEAIRLDGPYGGIPRLVVLDEMTRCETPSAQNAATALHDNTGTVYIPDARKSITIDPAVLFVWTANIGSMFSSAGTLDAALANRVSHNIMVDYAEPKVEALIVGEQSGVDAAMSAKIVQVATQLRAMASRGELGSNSGPSTRQLVRVGKAVANGLTPIEAYEVGFAHEASLSAEGGNESDIASAMRVINNSLR